MRNERKRWFARLCTVATMVLLALIMLPVDVNAKTLKSGKYEYEIKEDGTAKITKYTGKESKVTIPSKLGGKKVTEIADLAFAMQVEIRPGVFTNASPVKEVVFPDTLEKIGNWNFDNVTSIHIPKNVTMIGSRAFGTEVKRITVDKANKVYDSRNNCNAIIETTVNEETGAKEVVLVLGCENTVIPDGVTEIGSDAFSCYPKSSIAIPDSVKVIGYCSFFGSQLTNVTLPDSVTTIGGCAFWNCDKLKKVTIPKSVKKIYDAFSGNPSNMVIYAKKGSYAEKWGIKNGYAVNGKSATKVSPSGRDFVAVGAKCEVRVTSKKGERPTVEYLGTTDAKASTIKIPDTVVIFGIRYKVTSVYDCALYNNKKVKKLIVGKNVNSIGEEAFRNCTRLKSVELQSSTLSEIGEGAFRGDKNLTKITLKTKNLTASSVGKNALKGTNKKLVIKVPKGKVVEYKTYFANKGNKNVKVRK